MSKSPLRVLCVGAGHMGRSHALAYHKLPGFQIVGLVTRSADSRAKLNAELGGGYAEYGDFHAALKATKPDAVSISSYPDTHAEYAVAALEAGAGVQSGARGVHAQMLQLFTQQLSKTQQNAAQAAPVFCDFLAQGSGFGLDLGVAAAHARYLEGGGCGERM